MGLVTTNILCLLYWLIRRDYVGHIRKQKGDIKILRNVGMHVLDFAGGG